MDRRRPSSWVLLVSSLGMFVLGLSLTLVAASNLGYVSRYRWSVATLYPPFSSSHGASPSASRQDDTSTDDPAEALEPIPLASIGLLPIRWIARPTYFLFAAGTLALTTSSAYLGLCMSATLSAKSLFVPASPVDRIVLLGSFVLTTALSVATGVISKIDASNSGGLDVSELFSFRNPLSTNDSDDLKYLIYGRDRQRYTLARWTCQAAHVLLDSEYYAALEQACRTALAGEVLVWVLAAVGAVGALAALAPGVVDRGWAFVTNTKIDYTAVSSLVPDEEEDIEMVRHL